MCSLPSGFFNATRFGDVARKISPSVWKWGFYPILKTTCLVQCTVIVRCLVIRDIYSTNIFYKTWGNEKLYTNQLHTGVRKCVQGNSGHTHRGRVLTATKNLAPCLELVSDIYSLSEDQQRSLWTRDQVWILWDYIPPFTKVAGFNKVQIKLT